MRYPDSIEIDAMTGSFERGGGFHNYTFASTDETVRVVAWYEENTGVPAQQVNNAWCWQKVSATGLRTTTRVFPVTPNWLERLPAGKRSQLRTIIHESNEMTAEKSVRGNEFSGSRPWWKFW